MTLSNVALLIPAYNCEPYVAATLQSLMEQGASLRRLDRVILADDASKDSTIATARAAWAGPVPFEIFDAPKNRGEYKNVNEAVARLPPHIEWFLIMHADNLAKPGWLDAVMERIAVADEKVGTISTSWDDWFEDGRIAPGENRVPPVPERIVGNDASVAGTLRRGCWWHISSCAIRVRAYREVGGLPLGLRLKGDWDFLLRLLKAGWDVEYVPRALMTYRMNPTGSSSLSFRRHDDVRETLTVMRRFHDVLPLPTLFGMHAYHMKTLARRFVGGVVRFHFERAWATVPAGVFTLRSLCAGVAERALGRRYFHWVSSIDPKTSTQLDALSKAMERFYSLPSTRESYQHMIDDEHSMQPVTEGTLRAAILAAHPSSVLEIGCGSGRIFRRLREEGYAGEYTGLDLSPEVIASNRRRHPDATWMSGSGYDLPMPGESYDCVFAYYVLEHCIYPERFLRSALRVLKPSGSLFLVFPDFAVTGLFGSQALGLAEGRAREHLARRRLMHALVAAYDSRLRLPLALRRARSKVGPFAVNLRPRCLTPGVRIEPDVDAVYIASRQEVADWGERQGLDVSFPGGHDAVLRHNVCMQMKKRKAAQIASVVPCEMAG